MDSLKAFFKNMLICCLSGFLYAAMFATGFADEIPTLNMHYGVTPISHDIYDLHMTILWICIVIGIVVFSILIYSLIMHRKSRGVKPATFHENKTLEIFWAIVPLIILIVMAVPATMVLARINNTDDSTVTIKVTGYQWKWQYTYLDQGIQYFSNLSTPWDQINNKIKKDKWYLLEVDKPVVVPINQKIRFLLTSSDVIHSWWIPSLGIKKDAIPGFIHEAWAIIKKPGFYRGQCSELCGVYHAYMPIVIEAVTEKQFNQWVQQEYAKGRKQSAEQLTPAQTVTPVSIVPSIPAVQTSKNAAKEIINSTNPVNKFYTANELMEKGRANYDKYCAACHQADGEGISPIYPALKGDSVAIGASITRHIDIVLNGVPGTVMQAFGLQLTDLEIASIITYERNAWGNRTGDVIQPIDVAKQRDKFYQEKQIEINKQAEKALQRIQVPVDTKK